MCYINGVRVSRAEFIAYKQQEKELKQLQQIMQLKPVRRGFDYSEWPIIKPIYDSGKENDWDLVPMEWGFIPSYLRNREAVKNFRNGYKDPSGKFIPGYTTLNAMGEEVLNKKMYRESALKRRCLVISTGFYEHRHVQVMGKRGKLLATPEKFPYNITVKDRPYFFFPGIWDNWIDKDTGESVDTFALITTDANSLMRQIHNSKNRMPVILNKELSEEWTNQNLTEERILKIASYKIPSNEMEAHLVSKDFLLQDDPTCPCKYDAVPELIYDNG